MIKTAFVWMLLGTAFGFLMLLSAYFPNLAWAYAWRSSHIHLILIGGVIQLIMGVALWMFPRPAGRQLTDRAGWLLYYVFNVATVIRTVTTPFYMKSATLFWLTVIASAVQVCAIAYFVWRIFPRIIGPKEVVLG